MKLFEVIVLTAVVITVLLSSASKEVQAFDDDCWKEMRLWFTSSCQRQSDCPSRLKCIEGTCQSKETETESGNTFKESPCKDKCTDDQLCVTTSNPPECKSLEELGCERIPTESSFFWFGSYIHSGIRCKDENKKFLIHYV